MPMTQRKPRPSALARFWHRVQTGVTGTPRATVPTPGQPYVVDFNPTAVAEPDDRSNYIRTTKYTIWSFLPLNLYSQLLRSYNIYFTAAAIISLIMSAKNIAPISPVTAVLPLVVVLVVTMIKDGIEDYKRYRADRAANNKPFTLVSMASAHTVLSRDLHPGDMIMVERGQQFPADLILVASSNEDGLAYIATADLDGETNLKRRQAVYTTRPIRSAVEASQLAGRIECDQPNERLYQFQGRIRFRGDVALPLNADNLLLRGAVLRNTAYVYGVVTYVGADTKIMRNLKNTKLKFSSLERRVNQLVWSIMGLNAIVLFVTFFMSFAWARERGFCPTAENPDPTPCRPWWYIGRFYNTDTFAPGTPIEQSVSNWISASWEDAAEALGAYYVLYTYMVPISLFVTIEISRLAQALFMFWDDEMMSPQGERMKPSNSNLNEDLGRVDHIFSDKTGTLTQNIMKLRHWYIQGRIYDENGDGQLAQLAKGIGAQSPEEQRLILEFMRAVSVCHTVIPSIDETTGKLVYEGDSPDEAALLDGLRSNSVTVKARSPKYLTVDVLGNDERFELLNTLEFTSTRKRMSVVVRLPDNDIWLYCKGADNVILELSVPEADPVMKQHLDNTMSNFAKLGLRTLLVAGRQLSEDEYAKFAAVYKDAETSLDDREEKIAHACTLVEKDLSILGATAVEDKLQEDVAETIEYLAKCGIHIWMLTGDKLETAISIGLSTKLLTPEMHYVIVKETDSDKIREEMQSHIDHMLRPLTAELSVNLKGPDGSMHKGVVHLMATGQEKLDTSKNGLVITGQALIYALADHPDLFLTLGELCSSVICCRVSPVQKAQVVALVRKHSKRICLAIGDGANDVSMIQTANVGVGIIGLEGTQAVRASDYAFKEFRSLRRLISVHGRYSYMRMANLIYYSFYKNLTFILVQLWFSIFSGWAGQVAYNEIVMTGFNLAITAVPPFFLAIFERDLDESIIRDYPGAYTEVRDGLWWNVPTLLSWLVTAIFHSTVVFFTMYFMFGQGILGGDVHYYDYWIVTCLNGTFAVCLVLTMWSFVIRSWTWPMWLALGVSFAIYFGGIFVLNFATQSYDNIPTTMFTMPNMYFGVFAVLGIAMTPVLAFHYWRRQYYPSDMVLLSEMFKFLGVGRGRGPSATRTESFIEMRRLA